MNTNYTSPGQLEKASFLWSEVRLVVAALALFLGGVPPIYYVFGYLSPLYGLIRLGLTLAWIISGLAALYMLYRWNNNGRKLFGKMEQYDTYAFWVTVVSGINLGLAGVLGRNIGMSILYGHLIFGVVGLLYLATAWHLWKRWNESGQKVF